MIQNDIHIGDSGLWEAECRHCEEVLKSAGKRLAWQKRRLHEIDAHRK